MVLDVYKPENAEKRDGWWGPEHISKSSKNSVVLLAQVSYEEKLTTHIKFVRNIATKMSMQHTIYKLTPDAK